MVFVLRPPFVLQFCLSSLWPRGSSLGLGERRRAARQQRSLTRAHTLSPLSVSLRHSPPPDSLLQRPHDLLHSARNATAVFNFGSSQLGTLFSLLHTPNLRLCAAFLGLWRPLSFLQRMDFKYHIGLDVCRVLVLAYKGCHRIRKRIDKNTAPQKRKEKANAKSN